MARSKSMLLRECSGQLGKQVVVKQYKDKVVLSKYPNMSGVKQSAKQKANNKIFAMAVAYAQNICKNEGLKKAYEEKMTGKESVFQFAIKEFYNISKKATNCETIPDDSDHENKSQGVNR